MMQKYIILLLSILLFSVSASAQLEVSFSSSDAPVTGGTVDVDVSVSNFDNIVSAQYFILWDSLVLSYDSVFNVTDQLEQFSIGNIGTPETILNGDDGEMTVSWSHSSTNPFSLPDNTVLFTVRMNVEGMACDSTAIGIGNIPPFQNIEIIDGDFEDIGAIATPLPFALPGTDCESGGGGGGGGGGVLTISGSNLSGDSGDNVCMNVTVTNFTDILGIQGGLTWDPSVLSYTGVQNFGFTELTEDRFTPASGELAFLWFDNTISNPVSIADGGTLFQVCFDIIGAAGSSTTISYADEPELEFADADGNPLEFTSSNANISVNQGGGGGNDVVTISGSNLSGDVGDNVCMDVTVTNFTDILSVQGSLAWDPSVLSYTGVQNFGFTALTEDGFTPSSGQLAFLWFDDSISNPASIADGGTLFQVCFDIIGAAGSSTTISYGDSPELEFADADGNPLPFTSSTATISVNGDGGGGGGGDGDIVITVENGTGANGDMICIPITVDGLTDIQSLQGGISWDASELEYIETDNINPDLASIGFGLSTAGDALSFVWFDSSPTGTEPANLADGSTMFEICFEIIGDNETTQVSFSDSPPLEFSDSDTNIIDVDGVPGIISIMDVVQNPFSFNCSNTTIQNGTNGCFDITTENFVNISAVQLSITWDASLLTYTGAENFDSTIGIVQFNQTGGNEVGLTWDSSNGQGVSVSNGTTMFSICFDAVSCTGSDRTGSLSFVNGSQVPIEIGDGDANTVPFSFQPCNYTVNCTVIDICAFNFGPASISPPACFSQSTGSISVNPAISGPGCSIISCTWFQAGPGGQAIPNTVGCNLTNVPPGDYILAVATSDGVNHQETYTIPNSSPYSIVGTVFPVTCNALGAVSVVISGGSGNYSCMWEHDGSTSCNIGGLSAGNYRLIVTDNILGCAQPAEFLIEENFDLIATATPTPADCNGGSVSVSLNQAGEFNYAWNIQNATNSPVQNNLDPGTYVCVVTDDNGNCTTQVTAVVTSSITPVQIQPNPISVTDASCAGNDGSASFNIVGGCLPYTCTVTAPDGVTILPCDALEGLTPGNYQLNVNDASTGAGIVQIFTIGSTDEITATFNTTNVSAGTPGQILVTSVMGGTPGYTYNWSTTDGSGLIQGAENQTMLGLGTYFLTITDTAGCSLESEAFIITDGLQVGPSIDGGFTTDVGCGNDCNGAFQASISGGTGPFAYSWTDADGLTTEYLELPITDLCAGVYVFVVTDAQGLQDMSTETIGGADPIVITLDNMDCDDGTGIGSLSVSATGGVGGYGFTWTPIDDDTSNPENLFAGDYSVEVDDNSGCAQTEIFTVEICGEGPEGPGACGSSSTVLTPNGDNLNAVLNVVCASDYPNTFGVYDRFGRLIYETSDYNNDWDGTDKNGDKVTEGVYYWVMDSTFDNGDHRIFKGYVNVIRETK